MTQLKATATFTRPNDTTTYASGDLVANSTDAASVVAMSFVFDRYRLSKGSVAVRSAIIQRGDATDVANAQFRLHLFSATPTFGTNGDNDPISGNTTGASVWLGSIDVNTSIAFADDAVGDGVPTNRPEIVVPFDMGRADTVTLFGILEARAAYSPAAQEVFTVIVLCIPIE